MLRCARSPRSNVLQMYACARRILARLASEIFLNSLLNFADFFRPLFDEIDHLVFQANAVKRVDFLDAGGTGYVDLG